MTHWDTDYSCTQCDDAFDMLYSWEQTFGRLSIVKLPDQCLQGFVTASLATIVHKLDKVNLVNAFIFCANAGQSLSGPQTAQLGQF